MLCINVHVYINQSFFLILEMSKLNFKLLNCGVTISESFFVLTAKDMLVVGKPIAGT